MYFKLMNVRSKTTFTMSRYAQSFLEQIMVNSAEIINFET